MRYWLPLVLPPAGQHRSRESTENIFEGVPAMTGEGRAPVEVLKVSATSKPVAVAGGKTGGIRSKGKGEGEASGAGALNQAGQATAIPPRSISPAPPYPLFLPPLPH